MNLKKTWEIRRKKEGVSPVIATILMVAITVVLAAVLYVMVMGFGGGNQSTPTASVTNVRNVAGNYTCTVQSISANTVKFADTLIVVTPSAGANYNHQIVPGVVGSTTVGAGDYFYVGGLTSGTLYTITVKYVPTNNAIATFQISAT